VTSTFTDTRKIETSLGEILIDSLIFNSTISYLGLIELEGYGVATLAQNKIFPAKQELLLSEITGLPLDAQMQRNRLDVEERVEGSRQCSCSRPS
jgi:hypothetical protein